MTTTNKPPKRRTKWVRSDIQLSNIASLYLSCALALGLHALICYVGFGPLNELVGNPESQVLAGVHAVMGYAYVATFIAAIPLAILVGVNRSFRYSGPIYRLNQYMQDLRQGRWNETCNLRQGDLLQDVKENTNEAVASLKGFIQEQHALLESTQQFLNACYATRETVEFAHRIDRLKDEFARRMGTLEAVVASAEAAEAKHADTAEAKEEDRESETTTT